MIPELVKPPTIILCLLVIIPAHVSARKAIAPIAKPNCTSTCGDESIPFPFGIGDNCFLEPWFEIECKVPLHGQSVRPFLSIYNLEVRSISVVSNTLIVRMPPMIACVKDTQRQLVRGIDLRGSPYNMSTFDNVFMMQGCSGSASLFNQSEHFMAGCATVCQNSNPVSTNKCYGVDCCQTTLPYVIRDNTTYSLLQSYEMVFYGQSSGKRRNCLAATLLVEYYVDQYIGKLLATSRSHQPRVPVMWRWSWVSSQSPDISPHASCSRDNRNILSCHCADNYFGNPYVTNGCQDCSGACKGSCHRIGTSYYCSAQTSRLVLIVIRICIGLAIASGTLFVVFVCRWLYYFIKRRRKTERRVKLFKLMLQEHHSCPESVVERTTLFTRKDLDKATNHFNENQILGKGGQGTVYKGMLTDGRIVAIKKPKGMDETQIEQFINEVVILSQINHRNVVKLLGCCLETEAPLLVYEFISNGTLSQHIHNPSEEFALNWPMRLKIASDTAGAIAKVSDFGCSKTIEVDQTHLITLVQGTFGYLDPEYFKSNIYTEKSDVYSFGVVLLELLTSKKPIVHRAETMEQRSLVSEFLMQMQNFGIFNIIDPEVVNEAREEELIMVAELAKQCVNESGKLRPTMKEVAITLQMIISCPNDVTINQEALMKDGVRESMILDKSDMDIRISWKNMLASDASCSFHVDSKPLLSDSI